MNELENGLEEELDFLDELKVEEEVVIQPEIEKPLDIFGDEDVVTEDTLIADLLKAKGINGSKLTMLDEEEKEVEKDFYELTREEQLEILNATEEVEEAAAEEAPKGDLSESELEFIKHLRDEEISLDDYLQKYKEIAISEVGDGAEAEASYDIDAYTDEELFLLDLKSKYDLTDDELKKELDRALEDKELFDKKIGKTRTEYKTLEDAYKADKVEEESQQKEEQYSKFVDTMVDIAIKKPEFYGIELEDDEKNEVLSYLLEVDEKGSSEFYKAINDPGKLYEAAWFLKYGKEAFDAIRDAYDSEIKELRKDKPKKENPPNVVVKNKDENKVKSIYDLN